MKKTKKALASLAIAGMVLSMAPMSVFAADSATSNRIFGADRVQTAVEVAKQGWTTATTAIVAPAEDEHLVDALAAAPLAGAKNAPILLVEGKTLTTGTLDELKALGVKDVYVVGAVDAGVVTQLSGAGYNATAVKGASRMDTAAEIAKLLSAPKGSFVVGYDAIPDALSVASYAAANNYQILVANVDGTLPANEVVAGTSYVLGGPTLVKDIAGAKRVFGNDRYDTNKAILSELSYSYDKVYVANGEDSHLVDSLVASGLAGKTKSPIALTDNMAVKAAADLGAKMGSASQTIALGGPTVVADTVRDSVKYVAPATLAVESVSAINAKELKVVFNKAVDATSAETLSNYTATFINSAGASALGTPELQDDDMTVLIPVTTANLVNGASYKVDVKNVMDTNYVKIADYKDSFKLFNDKTAPSLVKVSKSGSQLKLTFDEPVTNSMLVKIDGTTVANANGTVATALGDYSIKTPAIGNSDLLKSGTHNVTVYNATDVVATSPNVSAFLTATLTVSDDTTAPSTVGLSAYNSTTFKVQFSEELAGLTSANLTVKKGAYTFPTGDITNVSLDGDDDTNKTWKVTVQGTSDNPLYATGESSAVLSVTVKGYQDAASLIGAQYDGTVTLTKDVTGPYVVADALNVGTAVAGANNDIITVKFNEDIDNATLAAFNSGKYTVTKDGVYQTISGVARNGASNKKLDITLGNDLSDGNYTVRIDADAVKDLAGNGNAALTTVLAYTSTSGTALVIAADNDGTIGDYAAGIATGAKNVITINYLAAGDTAKMTDTAIDVTNYTLDGVALPSGTAIGFASSLKHTVLITLPSDYVQVTGYKLLGITKNVKVDDGRIVMNSNKSAINIALDSFTDSIKPIVSSAKFLVSSLSNTTTNRIQVKFNEDLAAVTDNSGTRDDFEVKVNGTKVAVSNVLDETVGDDTVVLVVPTTNVSQSVTVRIVPANDQTVKAIDVKDVALNELTEGTTVNVTDKVVDTNLISDTNAVNADKAALAIVYGGTDTSAAVTADLTLAATGTNGSVITWASSNTAVVSNAGVVTRPANTDPDAVVTLTATITKGLYSSTKTFTVTVSHQ